MPVFGIMKTGINIRYKVSSIKYQVFKFVDFPPKADQPWAGNKIRRFELYYD
jgi:hypothetical protein